MKSAHGSNYDAAYGLEYVKVKLFLSFLHIWICSQIRGQNKNLASRLKVFELVKN